MPLPHNPSSNISFHSPLPSPSPPSSLSSIDWVHDYFKERLRLQTILSRASGILGTLFRAFDSSHTWLVIIFTGFASGIIAAFIDIVSVWLSDLRLGLCSNIRDNGRFYISKSYCCWGYNSINQCPDWQPWSTTLFNLSFHPRITWAINFTIFISFSSSLALLSNFLVEFYSPKSAFSGIPEIKTILEGFIIKNYFSPTVLLVKIIGLCLVIGSGLWLGKEGPLVHIACCCADLFMQLFPSIYSNEALKREILSAAAAAGISVAFGAPVGGVLFSLEQLSLYFPEKTMWHSFVCAMIAAVTLQFANPFRTGKLVRYQVSYHHIWHSLELIPFTLLGVLGGIFGAYFTKVNLFIARFPLSRYLRTSPSRSSKTSVLIISLITASISFPIKFLHIPISQLVYNLVAECPDITDDVLGLCQQSENVFSFIITMLLTATLVFVLTSLTMFLRIPADVILPTIAIGAIYGRIIGLLMSSFQKHFPSFLLTSCDSSDRCITPGTYAIIGAASALSGITRLTISIVVIVFELTGALTYALPIMIAVMIGKWVGDVIYPRGIYEAWINLKCYPSMQNIDPKHPQWSDLIISQVYLPFERLIVIDASSYTIQMLRDLSRKHVFRGFPIIENQTNRMLIGYILRDDLIQFLSDPSLNPHAHINFNSDSTSSSLEDVNMYSYLYQTPITLHAKANFLQAVLMLHRLGVRYILCVESGVLMGVLTRKDVCQLTSGKRLLNHISPTSLSCQSYLS